MTKPITNNNMSEIIDNADTRIKEFSSDIELALIAIEEMVNDNSPNLNGEKYMDNKELTKALHICERTLVEYRNKGKLPYYYFGGKILYAESDILKILKDNRRECWD